MSNCRISSRQCPHVRGGVPSKPGASAFAPTMSPRAWGCTVAGTSEARPRQNVPTCVGVYRPRLRPGNLQSKCPHVRGGVPWAVVGYIGLQFNVPTCVGVYRPRLPRSRLPRQCPHVRGGVPCERVYPGIRADNVPTCVGVYRWAMKFRPPTWKCPHVRGGVPAVLRRRLAEPINVPTCVGVYRQLPKTQGPSSQCPHVRWGVPKPYLKWELEVSMSPRAWGCTGVSVEVV